MHNVTSWLSGLVVLCGVHTAMLAQGAPPLQPAVQSVSARPVSDMLVLHEHLVASIHQTEETEELDPAFRSES
jgi:hypothetical protein